MIVMKVQEQIAVLVKSGRLLWAIGRSEYIASYKKTLPGATGL